MLRFLLLFLFAFIAFTSCKISKPPKNSVSSNTGAVIVNLAPTFTSQPASSTICLGGTPTVLSVTYTNGVGTPSYQWYSNTTNSNSGGALISASATPTAASRG